MVREAWKGKTDWFEPISNALVVWYFESQHSYLYPHSGWMGRVNLLHSSFAYCGLEPRKRVRVGRNGRRE